MKPKYRILQRQLRQVMTAANSSARRNGAEICGLLVYNGYFIELVKVKNKVKRGGGFSFYYNEVRFIEKAASIMGHQIIGTFHSHPYYISSPGESDIRGARDDSLMLIVDVKKREAKMWHIKNHKKRRVPFRLVIS